MDSIIRDMQRELPCGHVAFFHQPTKACLASNRRYEVVHRASMEMSRRADPGFVKRSNRD